MGFFDESKLVQNAVIIAIIAISSAIVLIYYSKKIKN
jgi:Tfp pilus assembly major pilin PilA